MLPRREYSALIIVALGLGSCVSPAPAATPSQVPSATRVASTATATPSPPPTATSTLAPAPRTFTEGFDSDAPYWQFMQAGAAESVLSPGVIGGNLRLELTDPEQWAYALYREQVYDDVRIDAVVDFSGGSTASAGLICRYDASLGWYEFNVHADRTYTILFGQWLTEGVARYTPLVVAEAEQISPTVNEIGLVCQGDILTPYVNTVQLRRRQETQHVLTRGQVGVSAAASDAGGQQVLIDWISVGSP